VPRISSSPTRGGDHGGIGARVLATNAFAADARTQFLNNLFDDPPAIDWPTNATGTSIYGLRLYSEFGTRREFSFEPVR
jgi:hypothetical protein